NTIAPLATSRLSEDVLPPDFLDKLKPEMVAPLVLFLCSEGCPVSGNIYNAAMGSFNRAALVTGPGTTVGDKTEIPAPEQVISKWDQITSLKGGKEYWQLNEQVGAILAAFSAPAEDGDGDGGALSSVSAIFEAMPDAFVPEAAGSVDVVFQYNISGVESGTHDKPTCTLKITDTDFIDMMNGRLVPMQAYTSGKLKIEGDIMKSQLIEKLFRMK
ncbi:MAG: SCP2 sterol-binding domain-containing protein, partial [Deltaproteobacteria bacterium]|nr:SCP2 sterol-binding domain-containing protein [Deltaproteobacteria bacterium]